MSCKRGCGKKRETKIELDVDFDFIEDYPVLGTPEVFKAAVKDGKAVFLMNKTRGAVERAVRDGAELIDVHLVYVHPGKPDMFLNSQNLYGVYLVVTSPAQNASRARKIIVTPKREPKPIAEPEPTDLTALKVAELRDLAVSLQVMTEDEAKKTKKSELLKILS